MNVPLIHIGYHKTATTWLQKLIFADDKIGFSTPFNVREIKKALVLPHDLDFNAQSCHDFFYPKINETIDKHLIPVISEERLSGQPHSGGFDSKTIAERLATVFPNAKILIIIREQQDIILSCYNQYIKGGGVDSLSNYINASNHDFLKPIPLFNLKHFMYHRLIEYYIQLFGKENVLVLPYEILLDSPNEFMSKIFKFCENKVLYNDNPIMPYAQIINPSISTLDLIILRWINLIFGTRDPLNRNSLFPLSRRKVKKIYSTLRCINILLPKDTNHYYKKLNQKKVDTIIGDVYGQSNKITSDLIGLNLESYNYNVSYSPEE